VGDGEGHPEFVQGGDHFGGEPVGEEEVKGPAEFSAPGLHGRNFGKEALGKACGEWLYGVDVDADTPCPLAVEQVHLLVGNGFVHVHDDAAVFNAVERGGVKLAGVVGAETARLDGDHAPDPEKTCEFAVVFRCGDLGGVAKVRFVGVLLRVAEDVEVGIAGVFRRRKCWCFSRCIHSATILSVMWYRAALKPQAGERGPFSPGFLFSSGPLLLPCFFDPAVDGEKHYCGDDHHNCDAVAPREEYGVASP